jgi:F-type H+-transporting ATPase subunit delta
MLRGSLPSRRGRRSGVSLPSASRISLQACTTLALESAVSKSLGRSVSIDVEVDPALIGGLQLKMGSRLVDASIRTKLNQLTNLMKGA